jgi:hypothetical protein
MVGRNVVYRHSKLMGFKFNDGNNVDVDKDPKMSK